VFSNSADDYLKVHDRGVDYADVTATLEREGVRAFQKSFASLLDGIRAAAAEARSKPEAVG